MNRFCYLAALALIMVSCSTPGTGARRSAARNNTRKAAAEDRTGGLYRVSAGDTLRVEYLYNEELNRLVLVRPDGFISPPLLEDVRAADLSLDEIRGELIRRYASVLKKPAVTLSLENSAGYKFYIGGEVSNPGVFQLSSGVTAARAVAIAGGARPTAGLGSVVVIRDRGREKPEFLLLDLRAALKGVDERDDILIRAKDLVFVPKSRIASIDQFVDQYMNQLVPFQKSLGVSYIFGKTVY